MRPDLSARLCRIMRGDPLPKNAVTHETPVTGRPGYRSKPIELQALQRLQVKNGKLGKDAVRPETTPETDLAESIRDVIEERAALCAGSVPPNYLDAWARLNHQKPLRVSEAEWRQALDDAGRFLDAWAWVSETEWAWAPGELFDVPRAIGEGGLIWRLGGALVEACGPDHVRLSDGRVILRESIGGERC